MKSCVLLLALLTTSTHGQDVDHPLKIGGDVSAPQLIYQGDFPIPHGLHSVTFDVSLIVDAEGIPRHVTVLRSNLPKAWEAKARESVEAYRFRPGKRSGVPVAVALKSSVNIDGF